jgi:hypothetical protein
MKYILIFLVMLQPPSFKETQLKNSRVKVAYDEKENTVKEYFRHKELTYSGFKLFIRAFKKESLRFGSRKVPKIPMHFFAHMIFVLHLARWVQREWKVIFKFPKAFIILTTSIR